MSILGEAGKTFLEDLNNPPADPAQAAPEAPAASPDPADPAGQIPPAVQEPAAPAEPALDAVAALNSARDSILSEIQSLMASAAPQPEEGPAAGNEDPAATPILNDDEFMEKFAENPVNAVMELADSIANKEVSAKMAEFAEKLQPFIQESEKIAFQKVVDSVVADFVSREEFADADRYFPQMAEIIKAESLPPDDINTFINLYNKLDRDYLRAQLSSAESAPKSLDDYLADENSVSQIMANPKIKDSIISEYLQGIANGAQPQVISSGGSSQPAAAPATQFNSISEAGKAFRQSLQ